MALRGSARLSAFQVVTTDGPSVLPYQYPPKIVTTDGPSELPYP